MYIHKLYTLQFNSIHYNIACTVYIVCAASAPPLTAGSDFPSLRSLSLDVIADHLDQLSGCLKQELSPALEEEVREHARKKRYYPVMPVRSRPLVGKEDGSDSTQFLFGVGYGWTIPPRSRQQ